MTYYPDLSPYSYSEGGENALNVGWLGGGHAYDEGTVERTTLDTLILLADAPENVMRGFHYCELCDAESPIRLAAPVERGYVALGSGEIHVRGADGTRFAAPTLVVHYITDHGYRPPTAFLAAVRAAEHGGGALRPATP